MRETPTPTDLMIGEVQHALNIVLDKDINQNAADSARQCWARLKELARLGAAVENQKAVLRARLETPLGRGLKRDLEYELASLNQLTEKNECSTP